MTAAGLSLCVVGALILLVAGVGVLRLPDALARQHAATKAGTLGVGTFALGVAVAHPEWAPRTALVVALLLATLPIASTALARAATRERPPSAP